VTAAAPGTILRVPLVAVADTTAIVNNLVWCLDRSKVFVALRRDVTLDISRDFFFGSDSLAVRVTCRVGFGYPHHSAIVKVTASGS
jgi:HK97 family phage major capsid protein